VDDKFFQQKDDMAMGSSLASVLSNIYVEHSENLALDSALHKSLLWLDYINDVSCGLVALSHLNSLRPTTQFTEIASVIPFWNVLVIRKEMTLTTKVYRKSTHTG
jgi:hypothetical protein